MHSYVMYRGGLKQCGNSTLRCPPQIFWHRPIAPLSSHLILILPFCAERPTVNYRKLELLLHQRCHRRDADFFHLGPLLQLFDWDNIHIIFIIFSSACIYITCKGAEGIRKMMLGIKFRDAPSPRMKWSKARFFADRRRERSDFHFRSPRS